jgi:hypothetical protein
MSFSFTLQDIVRGMPDTRGIAVPAEIPATDQKAVDEYRHISAFEASVRQIGEQNGADQKVDGQMDEWDVWTGFLYETYQRADHKKLEDYRFDCRATQNANGPKFVIQLAQNETTSALFADEDYCSTCMKYYMVVSSQETMNQVANQAAQVGGHYVADVQFSQANDADDGEGR